MDRNTEFQAAKDRVIGSEPFLAEDESVAQLVDIGLEKRSKRMPPGQIYDRLGVRLHTPAFWAEYEHGVAVLDETPSSREAELPLITGERFPSVTDRRHMSRKELRHEWLFVLNAEVQAGGVAAPDHLSIPQPGGAPVMLDETTRLVAPHPGGEVVELITIRQNRRQTDDAASICVRPPQEPLDLDLITDLALVQTDHVTLVEDEQADIVEEGRFIAQCKVKLLRRRDDDIPIAQGILIDLGDPDAPVEGRHRHTEGAERDPKRGLRLRRQRPQRGHEDHPALGG